MVEVDNRPAAPTTDRPIDKGNLYEDVETGLYVYVDGFYIDEDGRTQVKIRQHTDTPIAAHTSVAYDDTDYESKRTIDAETFHGRVASKELQFVEANA